MELHAAATPRAELIVRNTRQQGTRRALKSPITIVGSTKGCDVRLEVDSVRPIHCLIANSPEGPHLRSWGADDTLVNDTPVLTQLLRDGDILKVGSFEFEIRVTAPLAEAVPDPVKVEAPEPVEPVRPLDEKLQRFNDLQRQVGEARAALRRERADHETRMTQQLHDLAEARDELETREDDTNELRSRLHILRSRFLKRWKSHWSTQRRQIDREWASLDHERQRLVDDQESFATAQQRAAAHAEVETRRIEHGWDELRAAERNVRNEQARKQAQLDQKQQALADQETRLKAETLALHAERLRVEHHSANLRVEADGMESRVVNLRAVLLQLEGKRSVVEGSASAGTSAPASQDMPAVESPERQALLDQLAEELADQRLNLAEQVNRLAKAREHWRQEQSQLMAEMAHLAEQLRRRENQIIENEKACAFERGQLDQQATSLEQLGERLEVRQARLESVESDWRSELGRRELDQQRRGRELSRRQDALREICRRWSERRRHELAPLRAAHRRCEQAAQNLSDRLAGYEQREQALDQRELELADRALALEKVRQKLLAAAENPELANKKLERLGRRLQARSAKIAARHEQLRLEVAAERTELLRLLRHADQRIEEATMSEREAADRLAEMERREYFVHQEELTLKSLKTTWTTERAMFERERTDLRGEVDRLASIVLSEHDSGPIILSRAA